MSPSPSSDAADAPAADVRLIVIPGLGNSGAMHWQTWLQAQFAGSRRVVQDDWRIPDLDAWADRVIETLQAVAGPLPVIAAHSFGCLALARALGREPALRLAAALLVAPAEPRRFDVAGRLPSHRLPVPSCVVASDTDPWMAAASARAWALRWGSDWCNLGDAGHINAEAGFGPFPWARDWIVRAGQPARPARFDRWQITA